MKNENKKDNSLKNFFIKLISITIAIIVIINVSYNLIFAEKMEKIGFLLNLNSKENIELVKNKIRKELREGLEKEKILNKEDKQLLSEFYLKIKNEFREAE
jgi:3-isopropylmalate dehydratase small subunit|tara:strand:- start:544 stop:846 length:303 start_codon:yes stop_codon:yes gene_type:complete